MPSQISEQVSGAIDRLTDKCVIDRIHSVELREGELSTFFPKEVLADLIAKQLADIIQEVASTAYELNSLYDDDLDFHRIAVQLALKRGFQQYAKDVGFDILQQQVNARLQECIADYARSNSEKIWSRKVTEAFAPSTPPSDHSETEPRLFLWL
jgi:hypothetical protein